MTLMRPYAACTTAKRANFNGVFMNKHTAKIESSDEAWETGKLGADAQHAIAAPAELEAALDASMGLQSISIRLPKKLIDAYKLMANHHGVGYQPLMRDILQRYVPSGLKEVMDHHQARAVEADNRIDEWKRVA